MRVTTFVVDAPFGAGSRGAGSRSTESIGRVRGAATDAGLALVRLPGPERNEADWAVQLAPLAAVADVSPGPHAAADELAKYLRGELTEFTVPLDLRLVASAFARDILRALAAVPFGELTTYGDLATAAGRPGAARAVGGAVGRNPLPIVVP